MKYGKIKVLICEYGICQDILKTEKHPRGLLAKN